MFDSIKGVAGAVGSVLMAVPAASRISSDIQSGRQPNEQDLFILGIRDNFDH
ncbi:hypothetical protein [uncultured Cohaesibacter sp.]|uniref:hypothetical protein n=1 Tax=uncultured Cohaesibacter sp. TaxID=1002546 RepID=UPI002AABCF29|nr:hypothetical protein [uncultured Cohaesibacter sp.]